MTDQICVDVADARERLARHLFIGDGTPLIDGTDPGEAWDHWTAESIEGARPHFLVQADRILDVISGKDN